MESITRESIGCIDAAATILGDKWTPQLLRYFLSKETVRFCQIQELVGGINPRTLSSRLSQLEQQQIIAKVHHTSNGRCEYQLTPKGRDLLPILRSMEQWSVKYTAT
ncbi:MAG: helix-turn-helix domain-containing protein [Candidatus Saccharimonadales bacterium]